MKRHPAALAVLLALAWVVPGSAQGPTWDAPPVAEPGFGLQTTTAIGSESTVNLTTRSLIIGGLFLPTVASGLGMASAGTPAGTVLLTVHKAASVANLYLLNRTFFDLRRVAPRSGPEIAALVAVDLLYLGTMVTGSLLAIDGDRFDAVRGLHRATPWLTIAASGLLLALLGA